MKSIHLAIFDWNGTLLNDLAVAYKSVKKIFKTFGVSPPSFQEYRDEIQTNYRGFYLDHGIPFNVTNERMNEIRHTVFKKNWQTTKLHAQALQFVLLCKNNSLKTAIVSGETSAILRKRLSQFGLENIFDSISGDVKNKKVALRNVLDEFSIKNPKNAFYVDDSIDGLKSALYIGIYAFAFGKGYCPPLKLSRTNPTLLFNEYSQLINLMNFV